MNNDVSENRWIRKQIAVPAISKELLIFTSTLDLLRFMFWYENKFWLITLISIFKTE